MSYTPAVEEAATTWLARYRFTSDPKTVALIVDRAQELVEELGGYISVAHCERAYLELVNAGTIKPFRGTYEPEPEIPQDVINDIERTSAWELQRRYKTDPQFRKYYDLYQKNPKQQAQAGGALTVEQYRSMPAATIARKYQSDPVFKAGVDTLIARGLI